jgi:stress-induced morphogen
MCKIYNSIGCLTAIKSHLHKNGINEFKSLNEVRNFQKNYDITIQEIESKHIALIEQEKSTLSDEISQLQESIKTKKGEVENQIKSELANLKRSLESLPTIHSNLAKEFITDLKKIILTIKIWVIESSFDKRLTYSVQKLTDFLAKKDYRYKFIDSHFKIAVDESAFPELNELKRKKFVINEINNTIYGALGEQKVVKELEKLSDDFILINDFTCSFHPPIYNKNERDYIKSVQIDHVLISSSGIFLIETKNWSENSLNNLDFYSPVQQIKRASFALNKILSEKTTQSILSLKRLNWGTREIPIKKLIVLINQKPREEFQYVKILTLNELLSYINYFEPTLSNNETQNIANYLLKFQAK